MNQSKKVEKSPRKLRRKNKKFYTYIGNNQSLIQRDKIKLCSFVLLCLFLYCFY